MQFLFISKLNFIFGFVPFEELPIELGNGDILISKSHVFNKPPKTFNAEPVKDLLIEVVYDAFVPLPKLRVLPQ